MKLKLFLCVLCLSLFADGLLPQTAPVDEAARLTRVEMAVERQAGDISELKRSSRTEFLWAVGLVLAMFVAAYALVHQMRTQFSDFMAKMLDMHMQLVGKMTELQGKLNQLQGEMVQFRSDVDTKIVALQSDMTLKMAELRGDVGDVKAELRGDVGEVKIDVGGLKKDVEIVQKDVAGIQNDVAGIQKDVRALNEKVDGIDAHVMEVERSTSAQLTDIRETLAKQQEVKSDTTAQKPDVSPPDDD